MSVSSREWGDVTVPTIDSCRMVPPLTRFARVMARLVGVGAALGVGLVAVRHWDKLPGFVENNRLPMVERLELLRWFFVPLLLVPVLTLLVVACLPKEPRRLFALETLARRVAPLTFAGLLPPLLHGELWRGKSLLFLVATLVFTLLVYGSLRGASFSCPSLGRGPLVRSLAAYWPSRWTRVVPWALLTVLLAVVAVVAANRGSTMAPRSAEHPAVALTFNQALRVLGHGGFLTVAIVAWSKASAASAFYRIAFLLLTAVGALPLYAWARPKLGRGMALGVACAYLSFPPLVSVGSTLPLPLGIAAGAFFLAAFAWESKRYVLAVLATLGLLLVHEQTAAWLLCLCVYWSFQQRAQAPFAPWVALALIAYFVVVGFVWLPSLGVAPYGVKFRSLWAAPEPGMLPALQTLVTNPARALYLWCEQRELLFWLAVVVPFGIMPLKGTAWFLWSLPFVWFGVVAMGHVPAANLTDASIAHFIVMGFVAAVTTLHELKRTRRPNLAWATLFTWAFALLPCVYQSGCLWLASSHQ